MEDLEFFITALKSNEPSVLRAAFHQGWRATSTDRLGVPAICIAAEAGAVENVNELVRAKSSVDAPDRLGNTALILASTAGKLDVVKALLALKADIHHKAKWGSRALDSAIRASQLDTVKVLVSAKADVSLGHYFTPLMEAISADSLPSVRLLLEAKASPDCFATDCAESALTLAIQRDPAFLTLLIESKADINTKNPLSGVTPLLFSCARSNDQAVQLLLQAKASPNCESNDDDTPLLVADSTRIVRSLVGYRAQIDHQNSRGVTALIRASFRNRPDLVQVLMDAGADMHLRAKDGLSALECAVWNGHFNVLEIFFTFQLDSLGVECPRELIAIIASYVVSSESDGSD